MSEESDEETTLANLLLHLKDTSELMVDLSYSSFLYDREEIAEEVFSLEDDVDRRNSRVQRTAMELHRDGEVSLDQALATIRLAQAAEVIADSATEISDAVLRDVETHPVFRMSMEESDVQIARVVVADGAALDGATLGDEHVATATGMRVIAIRRGDDWLYGPGKDTSIQAGDVLVARGPDEGVEGLEALAQQP